MLDEIQRLEADSQMLNDLIEMLEKELVTINHDEDGYWLRSKLNRSLGGDHDTCETAKEAVTIAVKRWKENET
jgi:hypothetical protein